MIALAVSLTFALFLQQAPPKPPEPPSAPVPDPKAGAAAETTFADQVAALEKEFDAATQAFEEKYEAAKSDEERRKVFETDYPPEKFVPRFFELAAKAKGEDAALECYLWILRYAQKPATRDSIFAPLLADHVASPKLVDAVRGMGRTTVSVPSESFLRAVIEKSPHREVKGFATNALAGVLLGMASLSESINTPEWTEKKAQGIEEYYGKETIEEASARGAREFTKEAERLLEGVAKDYGDLQSFRFPLGQVAEMDLFELHHLQVGMVAPDVAGSDVDGIAFKLSDYRGKVVVLDFWGFW